MTEWVDIVHAKAQDEKLARLALEIIRRESGGWDNAKNPTSSASGLFQYIDSTFQRECIDRYQFATSTTQKNDPIIQIDCALEMLKNGGINHWRASGTYSEFL